VAVAKNDSIPKMTILQKVAVAGWQLALTHTPKTTKKQAILVYFGLKKPGPPAPKSQKSAEIAVSGLGIDDLMSENRSKMSENRSKSDQKVHGMYSDGSGSGSGSDSGWSSSDEDDGGGSVAATATATARDG
jgi:hypothetical protein